MICFPNAKINLGLYVTEKRSDGYHNIETVFYPVPLHDALEMLPASNKSSLNISGRNVNVGYENNIVWKAYKLLQSAFPEDIGEIDIFLHKAIPMGAGLGGGSADGAYMLKMMNDFFDLELDKEQLTAFSLNLGSDCPFFISNTPQFATGRGEILEEVDIDLSGYSIQIICPQMHISTAQAFSIIKPEAAQYNLRQLPALPVSEWKDIITNQFELSVFSQHPELLSIKQQLYYEGAVYASMSGSGSAVYGIMPKKMKAAVHTGIQFDSFFIE